MSDSSERADERPSWVRSVPPMIAGVALTGVVAVALIAASGCGGGGGESSQETVQAGLEKVLAKSPYGVKSPKVECPSDVEFESGQTVECEASAADGTTANLEAEVTSTSGEGGFTVENLIPVASIANQCSKELQNLMESVGIGNGPCEVECPELAEADPEGELNCHYELVEEEGRGGTVDIPLGSDGKTPEGGWEANEE